MTRTAGGKVQRSDQARQMPIQIQFGRLRSISAKHYVIRFGFGFVTSVIAAVVGQLAGGRVGGLFLAFPAILPATLTLLESKEGIAQALSDIRGATIGAIGMVAFAVVMVVGVLRFQSLALIAALLAWGVVSGAVYLLVRGVVKLLGEKQYLPEIPTSEAAGLINVLIRRGMTAATAESCTGGTVSALLCSVPDAGRAMRAGVTAYTDELKVSLLGVSPATLATHGAISSEAAVEMALGLQRMTRADIAIAITGATGRPAEGKPSGLTFIAVTSGTKVACVRRLTGDLGPGRNDERAVRMALQLGETVARGVGPALTRSESGRRPVLSG